jgi:hypothetical protein
MTQSSPEQTIEKLFELAIEIERRAANLYEAFSKMFSHVPMLDAFWQVLINDERRHEKMLREAQKLLSSEQLRSPADDKMWRDVTRVRRRFTDDLAESIYTLNDAYELAHDIEYSEVNAIFQFLASEWIPSEKRRHFVHSVIEKHLNSLSSFSEMFGDRDWRKTIQKQITTG